MRIARLSQRSSARPRVALERDGALYDVEALEDALGAAIDVPGDRFDLHTRVVALGAAGLRELDVRLLKGERPSTARVLSDFAPLAPFDTERARVVQVDLALRATRVLFGRNVTGQDDLVALPGDATAPAVELGVALMLGEDLARATRKQAERALFGMALALDWFGRGAERATRGRALQVGPVLVLGESVARLAHAALSVRVGASSTGLGSLSRVGVDLLAALELASRDFPLSAGDVVCVSPLPAPELQVELHDEVELGMDHIGALRGVPVLRRDPE